MHATIFIKIPSTEMIFPHNDAFQKKCNWIDMKRYEPTSNKKLCVIVGNAMLWYTQYTQKNWNAHSKCYCRTISSSLTHICVAITLEYI